MTTIPFIESRSGTGKTNVLFQHAISQSSQMHGINRTMPIGFITVSPLLSRELEKRYRDVKGINDAALQRSCSFITLSSLLDGLALRVGIDMRSSAVTTFNVYVNERKSHSKLSINKALIANEIGGVSASSIFRIHCSFCHHYTFIFLYVSY